MKIKNIIKFVLFLLVLNKALFISSVSFSNENICENETMDYIINNDPRNTEYNETRNDAGIHFDFDWNGKDLVVIKRNKKNYPIVRYSLFDNKNFEASNTAVVKINNQDLSKLSDNELIKLTYLRVKIIMNSIMVKLFQFHRNLTNLIISN